MESNKKGRRRTSEEWQDILDTLVGRKFGMLTVESYEKTTDSVPYGTICHCRCECGNIRDVKLNNLLAPFPHGVISCGCAKKLPEDLTGWVMSEHGVPESKWKVIGLHHIVNKKQADGERHPLRYWECECSCEAHTHMVIGARYLIAGKSLSCGCAGKDDFLSRGPNHKTNTYDLSGEYGIGYTTNTNHPFYFDLEDYDKIKDYCWKEHRPVKHYVTLVATIKNELGIPRPVRFHQAIGCTGFDHINHDTFDNRKENLRPCTQHQNTFNAKRKKNNSTGIIGVSEQKECTKKRWRARLMLNRKEILLGTFENFEEAVKARLEGEKKYYGEFAPQRHLFAQYGIEDIEEEKK